MAADFAAARHVFRQPPPLMMAAAITMLMLFLFRRCRYSYAIVFAAMFTYAICCRHAALSLPSAAIFR